MENKELIENELIEGLERNGVIDNYNNLFDEEDEITYLKPIIEEEKDENKIENEKIINLDEEENIQNQSQNKSKEGEQEKNQEKKVNEAIKEDESEESLIRIKNAKKRMRLALVKVN